MRDIDAALGCAGPPAIEYIFCDAYGARGEGVSGTLFRSLTSFGHALVRYTLPDGTQVVMSTPSIPSMLCALCWPACVE